MKTRKYTDRQQDTTHTAHTAHYDHVTLSDGSTVAVARGNLVAAKALLAAQKAADRRMAALRQSQQPREAEAAVAGTPARRHPQPERHEQAIYRIAAAAQVSSQHMDALAGSERIAEGELQRITLPVELPCALGDCGQPAHSALIEPDPVLAGLWNLLPVCEDTERHPYANGAKGAPNPSATSRRALQCESNDSGIQ